MSTKPQLQKRWKSEPGKLIRELILAKVVPHTREALPSASILYELLDGLPFREEVPNGRDFRGSDCIDGRELDFSDTDFSFATEVGTFIKCDLSRSKFDEGKKDSGQVAFSVLIGASFRRVHFRSTGFTSCDARGSCFDEAWLHNADFENADLRGASFRGADLKRAAFYGAKLQGCDFRGANLMESALNGAEVDGTTDFRGACLINAYLNKRCDNFGNLVAAGIDLKTVKIDATTRLGDDPKAEALEILKAALEVSSDRCDTESMRVRQAVQRVLTDIQKEYFDDWFDRVISYLRPEERAAHEAIMDDAYRSLL